MTVRLEPFLPTLLLFVAVVPATASAQAPRRLTAADVASAAVASSYELAAQSHELEAAHAAVDQANAGYYPRLTASARYTRLSEIDNPPLGNLVMAPQAAPGPLDAGDQLVAAPISFPTPTDQFG